MNLVNLKYLNGFNIDVSAKCLIHVYNESDLLKFWKMMYDKFPSVLLIGQGTNTLFLENYHGAIIINQIKGIEIREKINHWHIHAYAGEIWKDLVYICMKKNIPGLENMALIPGLVGSAPIQNIGAYGLELKDICEYVDIIDLKYGIKSRLNNSECDFSYRDSIFKKELKNDFAIVSIGIKLPKIWKPNLNHIDLNYLKKKKITPLTLYNTVRFLRNKKLPNSLFYGSLGSFFKNPIINEIHLKKIFNKYKKIPYFRESINKVKISAAWLIEECGLKNHRIGGAEVYYQQPLIIINKQQATSEDIISLANYIYNKVKIKFSILLEPEIRFIGKYNEIDFENLIK